MKKYIIIAGAPRSGKSTIASIISKKYNYQHISMDNILAGIENVFPETGINTNIETLDNTKFISSKVALLIKNMIDSGEYEERDYGVVIDVCQLLPSDFASNISTDKCSIYYFGTSGIMPEERFNLLKKYDDENSYTYYESDSDNLEKCKYIVELSDYIKNTCTNYGIRYFDTTYDRDMVINNFINSINIPLSIDNIRTPQDILMYMNDNFIYGWLDISNEKHIGNMKQFRKLYRTSSIDEILSNKIGTCIEQTYIMKLLLDRLNIPNKMYCTRVYEDETFKDLDSDEHMHCFLLYFLDDKVYHLEHPNYLKMGIHEYDSEESATKDINNYYINLRGGCSSPITIFSEVPSNLTFKEFNIYINSLDKNKNK